MKSAYYYQQIMAKFRAVYKKYPEAKYDYVLLNQCLDEINRTSIQRFLSK